MTPDREKVIKGLDSCEKIGRLGMTCEEVDCPYYEDNSRLMCWIDVLHDAIELLKEQETVEHAKEVLCKNGWEKMRYPAGTIGKWDDPEIVRCKDCKHCDTDTLEHCWCMILARSREPDWFCADGERQEGR